MTELKEKKKQMYRNIKVDSKNNKSNTAARKFSHFVVGNLNIASPESADQGSYQTPTMACIPRPEPHPS